MFKFAYKLAIPLMAMVAIVFAPVVSAEAGEYTSPSFDRTLSWDGGWAQLGTGDLEEGEGDFVSIAHEDSGANLLVAFVNVDQEMLQVRDELIDTSDRTVDTISMIEQGAYGNVEYRVDLLSDGDSVEGVFTLKMADPNAGSAIAYVLITDVENFSDGVSAVQVGIQIDGEVAMNGVDPAGMQSFLELAQSTATQASGSEIAVPAPDSTSENPAATEAPRASGSTVYSHPVWGYTVEYDSSFMDITDGGMDLMIASQSPLMVVNFAGLENPGAAPGVIYEALLPTFVDGLGPGGTYFDGGYTNDRAFWAGFTADGYQTVQQIVLINPSTAVIVTIMGEPGVPLNSGGEVTLEGISIFGN